MAKRLFEILDSMNLKDIENGTRLVAISNAFISADKVKQGAKITMGSDEQCLLDLLNDKSIAILMVIDKEEYFKQANQ